MRECSSRVWHTSGLMNDFHFAVVDCETTGLHPWRRHIVEIACVRYDAHGEHVDTFSTLVNPLSPIPMDTSNIHGIVDEMVLNAPTFHNIAPTLAALLNDAVLVAHNLNYDGNVLVEEARRWQVDFRPGRGVCTMLTAAAVNGPHARWPKLSEACADYGVSLPPERAHSAEHDAVATGELLCRLAERVGGFDALTFGAVPVSMPHPGRAASSLWTRADASTSPAFAVAA